MAGVVFGWRNQPVSVATLYNELNGEADVAGALRQTIGGAGPMSPAELERAVKALQASPATCRELIIELGTEVVLRGQSGPVPVSGVEIMQRMSERYDELGFFRFMAAIAQERGATHPLLPIEGVPIGGLPLPGGRRALDDAGGAGAGVLGVLKAIGATEGGPLLPPIDAVAPASLQTARTVKAAFASP